MSSPPTPSATPPTIPSRYVNVDAARTVHGSRVDELGPYLLRGDRIADAAVKSLYERFERSPDLRTSMLDAVLERGNAARVGAPPDVRNLVEQIESVPDWVDWRKINLAGAVYRRCGMTGGMLLGCCGLPLIYASPCANKTLIFSGKLVHRAPRRLSETARFVEASCLPDGMKPRNPGWKITVKVRVMHAEMRQAGSFSKATVWKHADWGTPVNQLDTISTNLRFSIGLLDHMRSVGFRFTKEEGEAVMMLWRYSGYLLGIEPELLCATEDSGRRTAHLLDTTEMPPDQDSVKLTRALMETALPKLLQSNRDRPPARPRWISRCVPLWISRRWSSWISRYLPLWITRYLYGLSHGILGKRHSEALEFPHTLWRYTARPVTSTAVSAFEFVRLYVPGGGALAQRFGARTVDRTIGSNRAAQGAKFDIGDEDE